MDTIFLTGLIGSLFLVTGAAWKNPKKNQHPAKSIKNILFAIGNILMLIFAVFGYLEGSPIFFIFGESLIGVSTVFMLLNANDRWTSLGVGLAGFGFLLWSLILFEDLDTVWFVLGLTSLSIGFILKKTFQRNLILAIGSAFLALFSYFEASWIFFWLNLFFSLFSIYHVVKAGRRA